MNFFSHIPDLFILAAGETTAFRSIGVRYARIRMGLAVPAGWPVSYPGAFPSELPGRIRLNYLSSGVAG